MRYVDVSLYGFKVEPRYYYYGWSKSPKIVGRASVVKALTRARSFLPKGWNFKIWDMQRPRAVQLAMIESFKRRFKVEHPELTPSQRTKMVFQFAAKPSLTVLRPDTHRNGGAVDLTIIDNYEHELCMGTEHDDLTEYAATDYYEHITKLSRHDKLVRDNRRLLVEVMTKAGFENYAPEWWHWSSYK